jgi:hypothetical protein
MAHPAIHRLPNEVLETILLQVASSTTGLKLVTQDLACASQVSKEWRATLKLSSWQKLLRIRLQSERDVRQKDIVQKEKEDDFLQRVSGDEALWLLQRINFPGNAVAGTKAKYIFKLTDTDLQLLPKTHKGRFLLTECLKRVIQKYGSIFDFREHVWKCMDRAQKAAKTSFQKCVARRLAVDGALNPYSSKVRRRVEYEVDRFVRRNIGSLEMIARRACELEARINDVAAILEGRGLTRADISYMAHDALLYESGSSDRETLVGMIDRHVSLMSALAKIGSTEVPLEHRRPCWSFVRCGGILKDVVELIQLDQRRAQLLQRLT